MADAAIVHVFTASGRFASRAALQAYLLPGYTDDGDLVPSAFCRETGLSEYEPACIESELAPAPQPLEQLLQGVSYGGSWLAQAVTDANGLLADTGVCVYAPNLLAHPAQCTLAYLGAYRYSPVTG
ncbi:immunity 22 family protein [Janthinobacterium psychrotolerans]|uniref:Immunity protein 22 n=1 Tax=Janthinobacterium psychrotolerans TaxID=1747903 RepID=A0A1A7BZD8_9BURK|nr:immunity 22 family protein [Janthinobacterium psychrotolerans]OBV38862.1 Immunity protein 22 [Janthinobacterium psychrotolerans]